MSDPILTQDELKEKYERVLSEMAYDIGVEGYEWEILEPEKYVSIEDLESVQNNLEAAIMIRKLLDG